jgi:hypothetical protein
MRQGRYLSGNAAVLSKFKIGASFANAGIIAIDGTAGVIPSTTTDAADSPGLALETATYSTTQGDAEGIVTVDSHPFLVVRALISGSSTENTAMTTLVNTATSTAGTTVTDADVGTADLAKGTLWCIGGANVGQSRIITTFNSATSVVVTVPFLNDIAVGDQFLFAPYAKEPAPSTGNVQTTALFTQADGSIAAGTGVVATVVDLETKGASDSYVLFLIQDHLYNVGTI